MEFKDYLDDAREKVDASLDRYLPDTRGFGSRLHEAMRYSVFSGGKRLRPCLCLMVNAALRGGEEEAMPSACALEMIHTYSLIHDDLPAMDNDDFRRGRPACHKAFDEATAILAGDALLTLAFEVIALHTPGKELVGELVAALSAAAGPAGMVIGQMRDLEAEKQPPELDRVKAIHETKTAAMISAAFRMGAIAARAQDGVKERVTRAGRWVGLAFQVVDDILDREASTEELGKTAGKDLREGKMTYPSAVGIETAKSDAAKMTDRALELLVPESKFVLVRDLALYMLERTS